MVDPVAFGLSFGTPALLFGAPDVLWPSKMAYLVERTTLRSKRRWPDGEPPGTTVFLIKYLSVLTVVFGVAVLGIAAWNAM